MRKKFFGITVLILVLVLVLFCVDTKDFILNTFRLNIEFWSSLISAIIGATVTIYGIYWTLNEENKKYKEDLRNSHKPYLRYYISIGVYPYRKYDQSKRAAILDYIFNNTKSTTEGKSLIFPFDVENIGLGHAIIQSIDVIIGDEVLRTTQRTKIIKKDENSVLYIEVNNISMDDISKLKLNIYYKDFFDTEYEDIIKVEISEGNPVLFDALSAREALDRYFKKRLEVDQQMYRTEINKTIRDGNYIVKSINVEENLKHKSRNFRSKMFWVEQVVSNIKTLLKYLYIRVLGIAVILVFGIFSLFSYFEEIFAFFFLTIAIDFYFENFILSEKIWISQEYKENGQQFNEDYYDLYWNFSKVQMSTILSTIAVIFPIMKKLMSSILADLLKEKGINIQYVPEILANSLIFLAVLLLAMLFWAFVYTNYKRYREVLRLLMLKSQNYVLFEPNELELIKEIKRRKK